jgi:cell wall-associated NlpC family hydrolase
MLRRTAVAAAFALCVPLTLPATPGVAVPATAAARAHHRLPPGRRIMRIARSLVGDRYTYGGASPRTGFDCSGLTKYVYARARIARLPHNAEGQLRMPHMRRIRPGRARPGDLVFYMSGGSAYHVAIYAGHHRQIAAATPRQGVVRQIVWSKRVQYRTDWH